MHIAIISGFNPAEFKDYLEQPELVRSTGRLATSVHGIVGGLLKLGHKVTVISSNLGLEDELITYSGPQLRIFLVQYRHGLMGLNVIPKMRRYIREHLDEFDVLHAQWTYSYAYAILPFVDKKPSFCSVRDWCPYLMTLPCSWSRKLNQWTNYYFFKSVMASKNLVKIANSNYTADRLTEWYGTNEPQIIIPNPVSDDIILEERKCSVKDPVFISISSLLTDPRKNIHILLNAFHRLHAEHPLSTLMLVGKGERKDFEYLADDSEFFDGVTFCGKKSHDEVLDLIDRSSVLVHPAQEETFGNIFLEAAARCIPAIGGESAGAVPHVLDHGNAGCLCDVTDANSIYLAMKKLITDTAYADYLVRNSMQHIRQKYAQSVVAKQHIDIYTNNNK